MKNRFILKYYPLVLMVFIAIFSFTLTAENKIGEISYPEIDREVLALMEKGNIPGLSLTIVKSSGDVYVKGYGYADLERREPVTPDTVFEIASCSKAFTTLTALICDAEGCINLDDPVSKYFPWFYATYKGKKYRDITLKQFLHQTSGISFSSISLIPRSTDKDALQQTVKKLEGIELNAEPGEKFEYAAINYDVVGAVIEKTAGMSYEDYVTRKILLPLGMTHTVVGVDKENPPPLLSSGYKSGFFARRKYDAPVYRGNTPAGYILSTGKDIARWLKAQLGLVETELTPLVRKSHQIDETLPFNRATLSTYALGWNVYVDRLKRIDHGGDNPNFSTFFIFNPVDKTGTAVMVNTNTRLTRFIAETVMNYIQGKGFLAHDFQADQLDKGSSVISFMAALFILSVLVYLVSIFVDFMRGRRKFTVPSLKKIGRLILVFFLFIPFLVGIYLVPRTLAGVSMETAVVFSPFSFTAAIILSITVIGMCYIAMVFSAFFPHNNKYIKSIPLLLTLSLLAGGSNAVVIFLLTTAIFSKVPLFYQLYNFGLAFFVYIIGRKILQTKLIRVTFDIIYDMRLKLLEKIFLTTYQKFEKIERGKVFAALNDDTNEVGNSTNVLVQLVTSAITTICVFIYMGTIAFRATAVTLLVITVIVAVWAVISRRTLVYFEEARITQNVFMELVKGITDRFKELSLQYKKKEEYTKDTAAVCGEFRTKLGTAMIKFLNAFLLGESMLIIVLGMVGYGIPRIFPNITAAVLMAFIMVLLYLIGPINAILNAIPILIRLRASWRSIQNFTKQIPANVDPAVIAALDHSKPGSVNHIKATGLTFTYDSLDSTEKFTLGPIDFEARKGEIVFIIGGKGSGKTTLAKLLTGLYLPDEGYITIDGEEVNNYRLGEYFSVVFSDFHLPEKLYNIDLTGREKEIEDYLEMLKLEEKVALDPEEKSFTTIELSGGQKKRLALLQCYLEDRPIYLFDEIAADLDTEFRQYFYKTLLKKMKERGKIVIAITYDDHYFAEADKVVKMDMGKIDIPHESAKSKLSVTG